MLRERLKDYALLMRMDKPIGILLLLWPTLWALWLGAIDASVDSTTITRFYAIEPQLVVVFILGVFFMRSAGCVINDFADRDIDKLVGRTEHRPLTTGRIRASEALILFSVLALVSLLLVFMLPSTMRYTVLLWSIPAIGFAVLYPFTKRFFATPQLVLGIAFSFCIPMAYAAYGNLANNWPGAALLVLANIAWVVAYDTQYAMVDRDDDQKVGVRSTALLFGRFDNVAIAMMQGFAVLCLLLLGSYYQFNGYYYFIISCGAGFFVYQHYLTRARAREHCFRAFLNNTWFGAIVWLAVLLGIAVPI